MAANYWNSSQRRFWTFTKPELSGIRRQLEDENKDLVQKHPLPDRRHLSIYFQTQLQKLAKRVHIRQHALATAQVYIRRIYTKIEIRRTNPHLVMITALYLACKMEECPHHIRLIQGESRQAYSDIVIPTTDKIGECEFTLISEMSSQLILHHPYRSLLDLQTSFKLTHEELATAEWIINDTYLTDLCLLHPPHVIAITAIVLGVTLNPTRSGLHAHATSVHGAMSNLASAQAGVGGTPVRIQQLMAWLLDQSVEVEALVDCTQELVSLYEVWESYNEKVCKDQVIRFVKARGLE
ncbi:C/H/G cyclin, partial [Saccharata proteae CBS 121410]